MNKSNIDLEVFPNACLDYKEVLNGHLYLLNKEFSQNQPSFPEVSETSREGRNSNLIPHIMPVFPKRTKLEPSAVQI